MSTIRLIATSGDVNWSNPAIWSGGAIPGNGDHVFIEGGNTTLRFIGGLDQDAVQLASLNIASSFVGLLGLKNKPLSIKATRVDIGYDKGVTNLAGSSRIHLDLLNHPSTVTVHASASSSEDDDTMPIRLKCANSATKFYIRNGNVEVAAQPGEGAYLHLIDVLDGNVILGQTRDVDDPTGLVSAGPDVEIDEVRISNGNVLSYATIGSLIVNGGTITTEGNGVVSAVEVHGGAYFSNSIGSVGPIDLYAGSVFLVGSNESRSIGDVTFRTKGASLVFDPLVVSTGNLINAVVGPNSMSVN